jgi:hypothetical protein
MCFARGDVRDHTILAKIDHEPSCRRYSALQRRGGSIFDFGNSIGQEGTSTSPPTSLVWRSGLAWMSP